MLVPVVNCFFLQIWYQCFVNFSGTSFVLVVLYFVIWEVKKLSPNKYNIDGQKVSADEYNKLKYEDLRVRVPKGKKEIIQAHAERQGESVNGFIGRAIDETMERDNT